MPPPARGIDARADPGVEGSAASSHRARVTPWIVRAEASRSSSPGGGSDRRGTRAVVVVVVVARSLRSIDRSRPSSIHWSPYDRVGVVNADP
eukprot:31312-Pelagococcus_subviridis.AAC.16